MTQSLYERSGGLTGIAELIFTFYEAVMRSPRLAPFFREVKLARLVEHQARFVAQMMGGPPGYSDAELRRVHAHLAIDGDAFEEMMALFAQTMRDFALPETDVAELLGQMRARRSAVVTASRSASVLDSAPEPLGS